MNTSSTCVYQSPPIKTSLENLLLASAPFTRSQSQRAETAAGNLVVVLGHKSNLGGAVIRTLRQQG